MKTNQIRDIIRDFEINEPKLRNSLTDGTPLTIWVTKDDKKRYDEVQKLSDRRFSKALRRIIVAALDEVQSAK